MIFLFVAGLALLALILVARLFGQLRHVNQRFDNVQARLRRLEEGLPRPAPPTSAGPSVFASPAPPPRVTPSPVLPSSAHTSPPPLPAAAPAAAARPAVVTAAARTRADLETEIGSRWALVIGVLVLVLGVAFFVRYAFDRHWVSETLRVGAGTAGRRRRPGRWCAPGRAGLSALWPPGRGRRSRDPLRVGVRGQRLICPRAARRRPPVDGDAERSDRVRRRSAELAGPRGHGDRAGVCGTVPRGHESGSTSRALRLRRGPRGRDALPGPPPRVVVPRPGGFLAHLGDAGRLVESNRIARRTLPPPSCISRWSARCSWSSRTIFAARGIRSRSS